MAKFTYRVLVQDTSIPGVQFIKDVMKMQEMGAVLDEQQVYMQFPRSAVFFLETDQEQEDYITVRFSKLSQEYYTQEDLDNLSIDTWRKLMRDNGIKSRNRSDGNVEYLSKFGKKDEVVKEYMPLEQPETSVEDVVIEEDSLAPSEVVEDVVESPVEVVEVKEADVAVAKRRGPKAK